MQIRFLKPFRYAGRMMQPGDTLDVRRDYAKVLLALKAGEEAPVEQPVEDAAPAADGDQGEPATGGRKYKRRDMAAEQ